MSPEAISDRAGEIYQPIPAEAALRQAEILAMRQLSDNVAILTRTVEKMGDRMGEVRDKVIQLEAQELKATLNHMRAEITGAVKELRDDHEKRLDRIERETQQQGQKLARLQGLIVPLASLGSALLAGLLSFVSAVVMKGHTP